MNTNELKTKVADLIKNKVLDGITDYHSDLKYGITITITLRRDANANVILNNLYKHTGLQSNFGITLLMLDNGVPKTLGLKEIISKYVDFQKEVIIRRTQFDLDKALARAHILEGYKIALDHLDDVIKIIRESDTDLIAKETLCNKYELTEIQADAILELKLRRLTGLERDKIEEELKAILVTIEELRAILASEEKILGIIKGEMLEIKDKYNDERKTAIDMSAIDYIEDESLIPVEDILIALTNKGYIKRIKDDIFRTQNRGGVGIKGMGTNEEDFPERIISMKTHDYLLLFTTLGKVYRMKGYEIPEFSRQSKGLPIVNLIPIEKEEKVNSMIMVSANDEEAKNLLFVTKRGLTKRTALTEFESIRNGGKKAILLKEEDELISVRKTNNNDEIVIGASNGRMVRFNENEVRIMGRSSSGVRGINIDSKTIVVGGEVAKEGEKILIVTENGYGKMTAVEEYRLTHRGSKGVKALNITDKNGSLVSLRSIIGDEDLIIITDNGMTIRISTGQISTLGRNTQGIKLINLKNEQKVSAIAIIEKLDEETEENNIEE